MLAQLEARWRKSLAVISLHWQSIGFLFALLCTAIFLYLAQPGGNIFFCDDNEKSGVICVRNWLNSAGNLAAALIALAALSVAFAQYKAARRQTALLLLPSIEDRIANAKNLYHIVASFCASCDTFIEYSKSLERALDLKTDLSTMGYPFYRVKLAIDSIESDLKRVMSLKEIPYIDDNIYAFARSVQRPSIACRQELYEIEGLISVANNLRESRNNWDVSGLGSNYTDPKKYENHRGQFEREFTKLNNVTLDVHLAIKELYKEREKLLLA